MAEITADVVKKFRERTGLPLMDCKRALAEANGDEEVAFENLRKAGERLMDNRAGRETAFGRFGIFAGTAHRAGAIVELKCESAPVTQNEEFIRLANGLAQALAESPGVDSTEALLALPAPGGSGRTLGEQKNELFNRIREVFNVGRFQRFEGSCGGYSHNAGTVSGVLLSVEGGNDTVAKDICMHIAAMRPGALTVDEIDPELVAKEREILREAALKEGKPENIVDKMVEGRLRVFFAEKALTEQPFVKDDKTTVGKYAAENGMKLKKFVHWELGKE